MSLTVEEDLEAMLDLAEKAIRVVHDAALIGCQTA
jgi:hypothetical protein